MEEDQNTEDQNTEDSGPEDLFDEESYESIEKAPKVYKLWHLIVAFLVGGAVVAGVFLVPAFGGQGFIGRDLPPVEKISDGDAFSSFTGVLTPELDSFTGELTPELSNLETVSEPDIIKIDPSDLEKAEFLNNIKQIEEPKILNPDPIKGYTIKTSPIEEVKIIEETLPVTDFEDFGKYTEQVIITNPVTDITNTVTQPTVEYKNIPIPTNYTIKTIK